MVASCEAARQPPQDASRRRSLGSGLGRATGESARYPPRTLEGRVSTCSEARLKDGQHRRRSTTVGKFGWSGLWCDCVHSDANRARQLRYAEGFVRLRAVRKC